MYRNGLLTDDNIILMYIRYLIQRFSITTHSWKVLELAEHFGTRIIRLNNNESYQLVKYTNSIKLVLTQK